MTPAPTTTTVFQSGIDLRRTLDAVRTRNAAFIEHALTDAFLGELRGETNAVHYEPLAAEEGRARQEDEIHVIHARTSDHPAIDRLRDELVALVCRDWAEIPGCADWRPNEISIQRYRRSLGARVP